MVSPGLTHDVLILGEREEDNNDDDGDNEEDGHHHAVPVRSTHTSPAHGAADVET